MVFFVSFIFDQDIRDSNPGASSRTFIQRTASPSPVRDVVFCPKQGYLLASAQENGVVSIWDTRQGSKPYRAFQGHPYSVNTLDWHPNWSASRLNRILFILVFFIHINWWKFDWINFLTNN